MQSLHSVTRIIFCCCWFSCTCVKKQRSTNILQVIQWISQQSLAIIQCFVHWCLLSLIWFYLKLAPDSRKAFSLQPFFCSLCYFSNICDQQISMSLKYTIVCKSYVYSTLLKRKTMNKANIWNAFVSHRTSGKIYVRLIGDDKLFVSLLGNLLRARMDSQFEVAVIYNISM